MTEIMQKLMKALALLVAGGLVLGGTIAFASGSTPSAVVSTSSASDPPTLSAAPGTANDDGTPDQGPGDVPAAGGNASADDDGTPDQGPGDTNEVGESNEADDGNDDANEVEGADDDNSGPSENSGPGSVDDNSGPSENSGPGSVDDDSGHGENG